MSSQEQNSIGNWQESIQNRSQKNHFDTGLSLPNQEFSHISPDPYKNEDLYPSQTNDPINHAESNLANTSTSNNHGGGGIFYNKDFNSPTSIGLRKLSSESRDPLVVQKRNGWKNLSSLEKSLSIALGLVSVLAIALMIAVVIVGVKLNEDNYKPPIRPTDSTLYPPWITTNSPPPGTGVTQATTEVSTRERPTSKPPTTESMLSLNTCVSKECFRAAGDIKLGMDSSIEPCQDFYKFACGGWIKENPIPEDKSAFDQFDKMQENLNIEIKNILESYTSDTDPEPIVMARMFYDSCLNQDTDDDDLGLPIRELIDEMLELEYNESTSNFSLISTLANLRRELNGNFIFSLRIDADLEDRDKNAIYLGHPDFALSPVYLEANDTDDHVSAYKSLIMNMWVIVFPEVDLQDAEIIADNIIEFERNLSDISSRPLQHKDPNIRIYNNNTSVEDVESYIMESWKSFVSEVFTDINNTTLECNNETKCKVLGTNIPSIIIEDVEFYDQIDFLLNDSDPSTVENYLKWRIILDYAKDANEQFRVLFLLYQQNIHDLKNPTPRWQSCVTEANYFFGPAISVFYIKEKVDDIFLFKEKLTHITNSMEETFYEAVRTLPGIGSNETLNLILENLLDLQIYSRFPFSLVDENFTELLEYYSQINMTDSSSHFQNILDLVTWRNDKELKAVLKDREETIWIKDLEIQTTVETFYSALSNTIHLPIAILQSPVYRSLEKDTLALNYGSLGMLIGRKLIEAFEDTAESYINGTLISMWDSDTLNQYENSTECIEEQFSTYKVSELNNTILINGKNTAKMNSGDIGGLKVALRAYMSQKGMSSEHKLPGLDYSPDQLFFMGFAQTWCTAYKPERLFQEVAIGSQAPAPYRVRGTLENMKEFQEAWNCPTQNQYSCSIW